MAIYEHSHLDGFPRIINMHANASYPSTSQKREHIEEDSFHPSQNHAEVLLAYFTQSYKEGSFTDITVRCDGNLVRNAQRLVLAAFSTNFEAVLRDVENVVVNLEIDSAITGVSPADLASVVDYMYSGKIKLRSGHSMIGSLRALGCHSILPMLSRFENNLTRELIIEDADHANSFALALEKFNVEVKFHDCMLSFSDTSIPCHRLVLGAFSKTFRQVFKDNCETVTIDPNSVADSKTGRITSQDMKIILEFMYTGRVTALKKRFVTLRESCRALKVNSLYNLLSSQLEASTCSLKTRQDKIVVDTCQLREDSKGNTACPDAANSTDYSAVYNAFVEGPARGKKLFCKTLQKRRRMAGKWSVEQERRLSTTNSLVTPSFSQEKMGSQLEEGFVYVDGVLDNDDNTVESGESCAADRAVGEKPFKCPFCDHRTKEKSAVEKHIRCIHTQEAPYRCRFCQQTFKIQSNLQRHIRTHTGFKPYICKKCGMSYADKKNMDAHIYREHLKAQPFHCPNLNCSFRCWRKDRFKIHCEKCALNNNSID